MKLSVGRVLTLRVNAIPTAKMAAFRAVLSARWRRVYDIGVETGWRISDILSLPVDALDGCRVQMVAKKTRKPAEAVISEALACALRDSAGQFWLFPSPVNYVFPVTRQAAYRAFKRAARLVGLAKCAPHSMRKSFAISKLEAGATLLEVQAALQHDRIQTTLLYLAQF